MSKRWSPDMGRYGQVARGRVAAWRVLQILALAVLGYAVWHLIGHNAYRIDIDVYRMGGRAWLDSGPLYSDGVLFHTTGGLDLPFTYPPLAAIAFSPFAWLPLPIAGAAITCTTLVLLTASTVIVLTRLDVWTNSDVLRESALLRRCWLAIAIVAPATMILEPIRSNFAFGQVNVVLMALVIADCVPRRTPWPRGLLLGLAMALKLTPAVFLLYLLLRRDVRATLTTMASFAGATLAGFALAWHDSWEYWTDTVHNTDRIGGAALNTNQNFAGALARLNLGEHDRFALWAAGCLIVLAVTVFATRQVLRAGESTLALICVALFELVVSPVSWSHHWVWMLPAVVVTGLLAHRRRNTVLAALTAVGVALMMWTPIALLPEHHESAASWWRQLAGMAYVWWALAVIVAAGITVNASRAPQSSTSARTKEVSTVG